jgi:hypothetical protein
MIINKKILNNCVSLKSFVVFLSIFISLFVIVPKVHGDLSTMCIATNPQDSQLTTTLALQPDRSYYDYYLNLAIEKLND